MGTDMFNIVAAQSALNIWTKKLSRLCWTMFIV